MEKVDQCDYIGKIIFNFNLGFMYINLVCLCVPTHMFN